MTSILNDDMDIVDANDEQPQQRHGSSAMELVRVATTLPFLPFKVAALAVTETNYLLNFGIHNLHNLIHSLILYAQKGPGRP